MRSNGFGRASTCGISFQTKYTGFAALIQTLHHAIFRSSLALACGTEVRLVWDEVDTYMLKLDADPSLDIQTTRYDRSPRSRQWQFDRFTFLRNPLKCARSRPCSTCAGSRVDPSSAARATARPPPTPAQHTIIRLRCLCTHLIKLPRLLLFLSSDCQRKGSAGPPPSAARATPRSR